MNTMTLLALIPGIHGWEVVIVLGIVLLLFGNKLPGAMRSLGLSFGAFKEGLKEGNTESKTLEDQRARPD